MSKYTRYKIDLFWRRMFGKETQIEKCARILKKFNRMSEDELNIVNPLENLVNHVGKFNIVPPFFCEVGSNIYVGTNFYANTNVVMLDRDAKIIFGDRVLIAPNVVITTVTHNAEQYKKRGYLTKDVCIGSNVWIGSGAIILPGVTIGDNSVIAAGAVVTKNMPANSLVAGVPAIVKKTYNII